MPDRELHEGEATQPAVEGAPAEAHAATQPGGPIVVGIGASAGGLEACRKLLDAMPDTDGLAFVLVQHLDPHHPSMIAELLSSHTSLTVQEARDGVRLERGHLYVIAPGTSLAVVGGALHVSPPQERHGARLPVDFLFKSLAQEYGSRCIAIVLSGRVRMAASGSRRSNPKAASSWSRTPKRPAMTACHAARSRPAASIARFSPGKFPRRFWRAPR